MKIVNEKGKLFGIINIIDLCVILAVILVAVVLGSKMFDTKIGPIPRSSEGKEVIVTVKCTVRNEVVASSLKEGSQLISLLNPEPNAYVKSVSYTALEAMSSNDAGQIVYSQDAKRKEMTIDFTMKTSSGNGIIKLGSQDVAINKEFIVKTHTFEAKGVIEGIEIK
ncbi:uncharacterized protein DUF4330 [Anaerobacterium chartisolvens]|uniref:Uncharacterized protein DUF4330 n=1 Tax=Anaerobacterium chartisolvens TaxID=1297424 RepID=A0A369AT10_9FIRM|nr:DUF4330 domain-containing protein [Anaerobacterium chartisolvens]RCX12371.1 uncharacterized protein DUF4330 [Anaerobacterium chartisolvens]